MVREVLSVLVNFLAYYEEQEGLKEQIEGEVQELKMARIQGEKRLSEEMRYLDKCKQVSFQLFSSKEKNFHLNFFLFLFDVAC